MAQKHKDTQAPEMPAVDEALQADRTAATRPAGGTGGGHGIASGQNPGGTLPGGGPAAGLGSIGTGNAETGGAATGSVKRRGR